MVFINENSYKDKLKLILDDITSKRNRLEGKSRKEVLNESLIHSMYQEQLEKAGNTEFTIASADNINFLHSLARVYSGSQKLNWHGTTIQAVLDSHSHQCSMTPVGEDKQQTELQNLQLVHTARVSSCKESTNVHSVSSLLWFNKQPQPKVLSNLYLRNCSPSPRVIHQMWHTSL